jgi:arginase family enzyme
VRNACASPDFAFWFAPMRIVPVLFPSDLGYSDRGRWVEGGERGAPDLLLDVLEGEGVRFAPPIAVPVPEPDDEAPEDAPLKFDAALADAATALADAVEGVNADANFPLVLGGDSLAMMGHVAGHSRRHSGGIGLAVLADAQLDLEVPAPPAWGDRAVLRKDPSRTRTGNAARMALAGALGAIPDDYALGRALAGTAVRADRTSVAGVRVAPTAQVRAMEKKHRIESWPMERIELDGEAGYRSVLTQHLSRGPIVLSIDVGGLDPALMTAVREPAPDGLDWSFLKRTLEQCLPHVDRILGLDICELDPTRDDAHQGALNRFAETLAPFLRRLGR